MGWSGAVLAYVHVDCAVQLEVSSAGHARSPSKEFVNIAALAELPMFQCRYAYDDATFEPLTVWGRLEERWTSPYTLLDATKYVGVDVDNLGGGYFAQFFVWWWVPAITSILAVALIPTVPFVRRVGSRGAFSKIIHLVCGTLLQ